MIIQVLSVSSLPSVDTYVQQAKDKHGYNVEQVGATKWSYSIQQSDSNVTISDLAETASITVFAMLFNW